MRGRDLTPAWTVRHSTAKKRVRQHPQNQSVFYTGTTCTTKTTGSASTINYRMKKGADTLDQVRQALGPSSYCKAARNENPDRCHILVPATPVVGGNSGRSQRVAAAKHACSAAPTTVAVVASEREDITAFQLK
jgi:hypothetical protein